MRLILFLLLALSACGPRNIDRSVGVGPQGGPREKLGGPELQLFKLSIQVGWEPMGKYDPTDWVISQIGSYGNFSDRAELHLDGNTSEVIETWSDTNKHKRGSYECLDGRETKLNACRTVHVHIPNQWMSHSPPINYFEMDFDITRFENCELTGQFDDESKPEIWARGWFRQVNNFQISPQSEEKSVEHQLPAKMHLVTDESLVRTTDYLDYKLFGLNGTYIPTAMRMPTRTHSGKNIELALSRQGFNFKPTHVPMVYAGRAEFINRDTSEQVMAKVWFTCHAEL